MIHTVYLSGKGTALTWGSK